MGFLEWLGVKSYKPDYGEAMKVYERMMDMSNLDKQKELAMKDWRVLQRRAFGDIEKSVASRWGGTGADLLGITSSLPGEWSTQAGTRWMQDVGNPMARSIEQEWLGATEQKQMAAEMARQQLEEQARAEAAARTGAGAGLIGNVAGMAASFIPGVGQVLGPALMAGGNMLAGASGAPGGFDLTMAGPYSGGGGSYGGGGGYNFYLDPRMWQNWSNPVYYPQQQPTGPTGGGGGWNG